jgi:hypothetical protein
MASPEKKAWKIYRYLDVEYVFVVFGALIGYPRYGAHSLITCPSFLQLICLDSYSDKA